MRIYGRQIASSHFDLATSLSGLPLLMLTCFLLAGCALSVAGRVTVTRNSDRLSIFTGVGWFGWTRSYAWSDFRSVREDFTPSVRKWDLQGRLVVMEGARRVTFGPMWSEDRRYFVLNVIRMMLNAASQPQLSAITPPRFT